MKKDTKKTTNGITLIALVITIIVLLILAGVSISMLSEDNSILNRATTARETTGQKQIEERVSLAYNAAVMEDINNGNGKLQEGTLSAELAKLFPESEIEIDTETDTTGKKWYVTIDGGTPIEVEAGKSGGEEDTGVKDKNGVAIKTTNETTPFLPNPSKNEITNNDLSTGLTIKDENNNEWVWIVVPKSADVYKTAGIGKTLPAVPDTSENSIYTKIEADLRKYCETGKDGNPLIAPGTSSSDYKTTTVGYTDEYVAGKGANLTSPEVYKTYKQKMLKSVYENGGFYIGKYETGTATARKNKTDSLTIAVIKQNAYPYNYVTNAQAEDLSEGLKTGEKTTTLLFGVQWDLVLRHLSELGVATSYLTGADSSQWGNYSDAQFTLDRGKYVKYITGYKLDTTWNDYDDTTKDDSAYVLNKVKQKNTSSSEYIKKRILYTTGASDNNSKKNIYDLAGNVYEWTLEKTSDTYSLCARRGGGFNSTGSINPASHRYNDDTSSSDYSGGFRVSLY